MKKLLVLLSLSMSMSFADDRSYDELVEDLRKIYNDGGLKLNEWKIYLNAKKNRKKDWIAEFSSPVLDYSLPNLKFYKNSKLQGAHSAEVNEEGLFIDGKFVCKKYKQKKRDEVNAYFYDFLHVKKTERCKSIPFSERTRKNLPAHLILNLQSINGNVGEVRIKSKTYYLDIDPFKDLPRKKPTKLLLQERHGKEGFREIDNLLSLIRRYMQTRNLVQLNKLFSDKCLKNSESRLQKTKRGDNQNLPMSYYVENKFLELTLYEALSVSSAGRHENKWFLLYSEDGRHVRMIKVRNSWVFECPEIPDGAQRLEFLMKAQ